MGKVISLMAAMGIIAGGLWAHAGAGAASYSLLNEELPWPFGSEIAFPWEDIEGIWMGERTDAFHTTYFSLRVKNHGHQERVLEIHELAYDIGARRFKILSQGQGVESHRVVRGQMVGIVPKGRYRFSIRAFEEDQKYGKVAQITRVLTVAPIDPTDERSLTFVLHRVSDQPIED